MVNKWEKAFYLRQGNMRHSKTYVLSYVVYASVPLRVFLPVTVYAVLQKGQA